MNYWKKPGYKQWSTSYIYESPEGWVTHRQRENVGYGFTTLYFLGTQEQVLACQEREKNDYPINGYGGRYHEPEDLGNGLWLAMARHSESCD